MKDAQAHVLAAVRQGLPIGGGDDPLDYFVHDVQLRNLPKSMEAALISMALNGTGTFKVNEEDLSNPSHDLHPYFGRYGMAGISNYVSKNLADYLQKFGFKFKWEQDEHIVGAGHERRISAMEFRFHDPTPLPERKHSVQLVLDELSKQRPVIIENAISTLESNFSQNFGKRGRASTQAQRCRDMILKGRNFEITLSKSAAKADQFGVWSPQKRLQFLLGGFERALGMNLAYVWRDETAGNIKVEIRSTQKPKELECSILQHIVYEHFVLVPLQE